VSGVKRANRATVYGRFFMAAVWGVEVSWDNQDSSRGWVASSKLGLGGWVHVLRLLQLQSLQLQVAEEGFRVGSGDSKYRSFSVGIAGGFHTPSRTFVLHTRA
jgi:hypothetical protein